MELDEALLHVESGELIEDAGMAIEPPASPSSPTAGRAARTVVSQACVPCRRAHAACDHARPCARCVRRHTESACVDHVRGRRGARKTRLLEDDENLRVPRIAARLTPSELQDEAAEPEEWFQRSVSPRRERYAVLNHQKSPPCPPLHPSLSNADTPPGALGSDDESGCSQSDSDVPRRLQMLGDVEVLNVLDKELANRGSPLNWVQFAYDLPPTQTTPPDSRPVLWQLSCYLSS